MDERDLGELGEATLRAWAAQAGIIANKTEVDKGGWDFFLQLRPPPTSPEKIISLDRLPGPLECLLQVKATDTGDPPNVTLTNWDRFCNNLLPSFFLVLHFAGRDTPQDAYLIHVDEKWVGKLLKKTRNIPPNQYRKLHEHGMRLTWGVKQRLPEANGRSLRAELLRYTGLDPAAYMERKAQWRRTVGYGETQIQGKFIILPEANRRAEDRLIDLALGLTDELPVEVTALDEIRFGILRPLDQELPAQAVIKAKPQPIGGVLLTFSGGDRRARFKCELYTPLGVIQKIRKESIRLRFSSSLVEFILHFAPLKIDFSFSLPPPRALISLSLLKNYVELVSMLDEAHKKDTPIDLSLSVPDHVNANLNFKPSSSPPAPLIDQDIAKAIVYAWNITRTLDLDPEAEVSLALMRSMHDRLHECDAILHPRPTSILLEGEGPLDLPPNADLARALVSATVIGKTLIVLGAAAYGRPQFEEYSDENGKHVFRTWCSLHRVVTRIIDSPPEKKISLIPYYNQVEEWIDKRENTFLIPSSFEDPKPDEPS